MGAGGSDLAGGMLDALAAAHRSRTPVPAHKQTEPAAPRQTEPAAPRQTEPALQLTQAAHDPGRRSYLPTDGQMGTAIHPAFTTEVGGAPPRRHLRAARSATGGAPKPTEHDARQGGEVREEGG
jgi:hypothetical protein